MGTDDQFCVLGTGLLLDFIEKHPEASSQVCAWNAEMQSRNWADRMAIIRQFPTAKMLPSEHIRFVICSGKYGIDVIVHYPAQFLMVADIVTIAPADTPFLFSLEC